MIDEPFHPMFRLDMGPLHYFSVLGRALFTAQHLEMNCRAISAFFHSRKPMTQHGSSVLDDPGFRKEICDLWKRTLGQHAYALKIECVFSDATAPILDAAVKARNELAHAVAMDVTDRLDAQLSQRIDQIRDLVTRIAKADKLASATIHLLNEGPLPAKQFFDSYEERVAAWVTQDTFEELRVHQDC